MAAPTLAERYRGPRWCMAPLIVHTGADTPLNLARLLGQNTSSSGAVAQAWRRWWCTDEQSDRWAIRAGTMAHNLWPGWTVAGLSALDRAHPLEEWWRPAWEWAHPLTCPDTASLTTVEAGPSDDELAAIEADEAAA